MQHLVKAASAVAAAVREVFSKGRYVAVAVGIAFIVFLFAVWLPNLSLIWNVATSSYMSLGGKAAFLFTSLGAVRTNFTIFSATLTIVVAILFGLNIAMLTYYLRWRKEVVKASGGTSIGGLAAGILGMGCASCGSVLLSALGISGALTVLPFRGQEFNIIGVILLSVSIVMTAKRILAKGTCAVPAPRET